MLRRLSPNSRQVVDRAQHIAREYELDYVDTEHMLLAIAEHADNPAARLLVRCGVTTERLRKSIEGFLKGTPAETWMVGRLPGTLHVRNAIARAIEVAEAVGAPAVEPIHLLVALSKEEGSAADQLLRTLGVDTAKIQQALDKEP